MTACRVLLSRWLPSGGISVVTASRAQKLLPRSFPALSVSERFLSSDGKSGGGGGKDSDDEDPFGLNFEDGEEEGKIGSSMPPKYVRDSATGKFTGEQVQELTADEKRALNLSESEEEDFLVERMLEDVDLSEDDSDIAVVTKEMRRDALLAKRIREENMAVNVLGRSVSALTAAKKDGEETYEDPSGFSKPLSSSELNVFKKYMKDEYDEFVDESDIPVDEDAGVLDGFVDNDYLNNKWLSSPAVRFMDESKDDDPFMELLPADLNPSMYVNRKKAKLLPRGLLHHNNLALLRRYITPSGLIMNRMHSRLGAKDQRKIARLVKRARQLRLIPFQGQFIVEDHGDIHEEGLEEDNEWEEELVRRGLVINGTAAENGDGN